MIWRIDDDRAMGRKKRKVAIISLDADELQWLAERSQGAVDDQLSFDLITCRAALLREEVEARR